MDTTILTRHDTCEHTRSPLSYRIPRSKNPRLFVSHFREVLLFDSLTLYKRWHCTPASRASDSVPINATLFWPISRCEPWKGEPACFTPRTHVLTALEANKQYLSCTNTAEESTSFPSVRTSVNWTLWTFIEVRLLFFKGVKSFSPRKIRSCSVRTGGKEAMSSTCKVRG
jgi:hypothetical protein